MKEVVVNSLGRGRVLSKRNDGFLVVQLQWRLADGQHAVCYAKESDCTQRIEGKSTAQPSL